MRVFISYCREIQEETRRLVADLEDLGHQVWQDQKLSGGQSWWDHILEQIRGCDVFVFALSTASLESKACERECDYAVALGKVILPIHVADRVAPEVLPPALAAIQIADLRGSERDRILQLVQAFRALPEPGPLPDPLPRPPEVPISYLGSLRTQIDAEGSMSFEDQTAILFRLREGLRKGDDEQLIGELLRRLKRRSDLLARVGEQIDVALDGMAREDARGRGPGGSTPMPQGSAPALEKRVSEVPAAREPGSLHARFVFPGSLMYGGLGTDHAIAVLLDGQELGQGSVRKGFDVEGTTTPGRHILTIDAVGLGAIRKTLNTVAESWPVELPVRLPEEEAVRVDLIVGKLSVKWKVKQIDRV